MTASDLNSQLRAAAFEGKHQEVVALLEQGADPNTADASGWTALHMAAQRAKNGLVSIIQTLVAHGADPRARARTYKGFMNALMLLDQRSVEEREVDSAIELLERLGVDRPPGWAAKFREARYYRDKIQGP